MKKFLAIFVTFVIFFSFNIATYAAEDYVSQDEFLERMAELYEKYGVGFEVIEADMTKRYTEEEVAVELEKLEERLKSLITPSYVEPVIIEDKATEDEDLIKPNFFYYTRTYTSYDYVANVYGGAQIEIKCDAEIFGGSTLFTKICNIRTRQYGIAVNFVSWEQIDSDYTIYDGGRKALVSAVGTLVTEADIEGIKIRETYDHEVIMLIEAY